MKVKGYVLRSAIIAALGGLLFGFDVAVISGTTGALAKVYGLNTGWLGFTVASALIGTIIGAVIAGRPADRFGRRTVLGVIALLYAVSALGSALAPDWYSFIFFRLIGGIGVGGASVVSPLYIAEISPAKYRGRLVAITQFNIVFGILLAYFSNYLIGEHLSGYLVSQLGQVGTEWRWMFGVETVPALAFFFLLFLTPLSPRWLLTKGREDEAREVLGKLGTDSDSVDEEIKEIQSSLDLSHHSIREPFFRKAYMKPIMLAVAIAAFNQLSGINALIFYAPSIFAMAGAGKSTALLSSVGVGFVNLIFTMAALLVIDHFGRRKLMLAGSIGYIASLSAVAAAFYAYGNEFSAAKAFNETLSACQAVSQDSDSPAAKDFAELAVALDTEPLSAETLNLAAAACESALPATSDSAVVARGADTLTEAARSLREAAANAPGTDNLTATKNACGLAATGELELADPNTFLALTAVSKVCDTILKEAKVDPKANIAVGSMVVLVGLLVFIAAHAFGQGAVIWVFISEIFPNRVRARGQALGSFTHWIMAALISQTFPMIAEQSGGHVFSFYAVMMVLQLLWVLFIMPETKGVPLEKIQKELGIE